MGQQNLALGLKFNAKAVLDCFEKELEILPHGRRREIDFKMVDGDFQLFEGKWSIEQVYIIRNHSYKNASHRGCILIIICVFRDTARQRDSWGVFGFTV